MVMMTIIVGRISSHFTFSRTRNGPVWIPKNGLILRNAHSFAATSLWSSSLSGFDQLIRFQQGLLSQTIMWVQYDNIVETGTAVRAIAYLPENV
jgi:hypothetical protein